MVNVIRLANIYHLTIDSSEQKIGLALHHVNDLQDQLHGWKLNNSQIPTPWEI